MNINFATTGGSFLHCLQFRHLS